MEIAQSFPLLPGDPRLIDHIVCELKSQGIFDQFRKECIADVDTKPAYQNLRQRVEGSVAGFLSNQKWKPDLNKNQLREKLRKHILDSNFLDQGVERIVDQAVNPKIASVFLPQVEEVVYKCFGLEKPERSDKDYANGVSTSELKIITEDLLPEDLEAVSPDSVKSHEKRVDTSFENIELPPDQIMVEKKEETEVKVERIYPSVDTEESDDSKDEEFESPAFEPLDDDLNKREGSPNNSQMSGLSDLNSRDSNDSNSNAEKVKISEEKVVESTFINSQLSQGSNDSEVSIKVSKMGKKSLLYDSTFSGDDANINSPAKRDPVDACFKFSNHDDNSSDARQCFEPTKEEPMECDDNSVDKTFVKSELKTEEVVKSTSSSETAEPIKHHRSSVDSKTSSEGLKIVDKFDVSLDSTESSSIFTNTVKTESYIVKDSYTFTNKITSMDEGSVDDDSSSNGLKIDLQETVHYTEENITGIDKLSISEDVNMKSPNDNVKKDLRSDKSGGSDRHKSFSKDERRSSSSHHSKDHRDKRDDHHSKSSHSRHRESSGHHERKHSSSQDRKDGSHSKSSKESGDKDKYGKSSNGESRKDSSSDRHKSSSSRHSSSSKHYGSSKHRDESHRSRHSTSDKSDGHGLSHHDSHRSDKDRDSSKRSESKEPSKHRDKGSDHSSTERSKSLSHGPKDKSSSKHSHDKERKSSSSGDKKDDKKGKDKSDKDDHYSSSGRGNRTRRSTDRDSNDGNNGSNKSSSSNSVESSTSANPSNKEKSGSSSKDNCSNGNVSSGQSDNATKAAKDKLNILAGGYIKSEFNMFEPVVKKPMVPLMNLHRSPEILAKKPVIHIDSQLNPCPVKVEEEKTPEPVIEDTLPKLKKPKFASNIFEARKLMKVRKNMDKMELKRKQDAQELIEKQNNVSKSESRVFSGVSGPELHIACTKTLVETPKKSSKIRRPRDDSDFEPDFLGFDEEFSKKLQIDLEKVKKHLKDYLATVNGVEHRFESVVHLIGCDKSLEQAFVRLSRKNHMVKTVNLRKNGFVKQNVEKSKVCPQKLIVSPDSDDSLPSSSRFNLSDLKNTIHSEMMKAKRLPLKKRKLAQRKIIKSLEMKPDVVQENLIPDYDDDDCNIRNIDISNEYGSEYYSKMDEMLSRATKQDIMEIILGGEMKFDASSVDLKLIQDEYIDQSSDLGKIVAATPVIEKPNGKVAATPRKRKFEIVEEISEGQRTNFNNNLKQQNEPTVAKRRYIQKVAHPEESIGVALVPTNNKTQDGTVAVGKTRRVGLSRTKKSSGISRNTLSIPSSPESDKSVENHINRDVYALKSKNFKENSEDVGSTALNHANHQMGKRTRNNFNKAKITVKNCINEKLFV